MSAIDIRDFDERLNSLDCSQVIREIVACLRDAAEQAGGIDVSSNAYSTASGGWGITYKRDQRVFCRFDPKPNKLHVWAFVLGADTNELTDAGTLSAQKGWVAISNLRSAELLAPAIVRAYTVAGAASLVPLADLGNDHADELAPGSSGVFRVDTYPSGGAVRQGSLKLYATLLRVSDLKRPKFYTISKLDPDGAGPGYQRLLTRDVQRGWRNTFSTARPRETLFCRRRSSWPPTKISRSIRRPIRSRLK